MPELQQESFDYDDDNRRVIHTDFNGDTITTQMDNMGRTETISYSKDGRVESYSYYPNGQVDTITTPEGITDYGYDNRNRLEQEVKTDGTVMN